MDTSQQGAGETNLLRPRDTNMEHRVRCVSSLRSLITIRFGSGEQLLGHGISFRHGDDGEGGRGKREKEGEEAGKHA